MKKIKNAFTLVELIIVITIVSILSTLLWISFEWYVSSARDSVRMSDIKTAFWWLSIYKIKTWNYPNPDNSIQIKAGNILLNIQGELWWNTKQIISLNGKAQDPKDKSNYIYSISSNLQKAQLMWYLEKTDNFSHISFIEETFANEISYLERQTFIYGDKLWIITDKNNTPIQYTLPPNQDVDLLDESFSQKDLITHFWWDTSTSTGSQLAEELEQISKGTIFCKETEFDWYNIWSIRDNDTKDFLKETPINNGYQTEQLTIQCKNWVLQTETAMNQILSTTCTTDWYVAQNNVCVENVCSGEMPSNAFSNSTSQNPQWSWSYNETPSECSFQCNAWFTYDTNTNSCLWNSCETPTSDSYNEIIYSLTSENIAHWSTLKKTWTSLFWTSPRNGTLTAEFEYSCEAGFLQQVSVQEVSGSCSTQYYSFNNSFTIPSCNLPNCALGTTFIIWWCQL